MIRTLRALALAALVWGPTKGSQAAETDQALLAPGERIVGRFVQERHFANSPAPLRSSGRFVLEASGDLLWRTESPVEGAIVVTRAGLVQFVDGKEVLRLGPRQLEVVAGLIEFLREMLAGRLQGARRDESAEPWDREIVPAPGERAAAAGLRRISVRGRALAEQAVVEKTNGDREVLTFSDQRIGVEAPPAEDRALLDMARR